MQKYISRCWLPFKELPLSLDQIEHTKWKKYGAINKYDALIVIDSRMHHHDICYIATDNNIISPHFGTLSKISIGKILWVVESIVMHDLPSSFVEDKRIRAIFAYISSTVELSCINTIKSHVLKLFSSEKLKLQNLLDSVQGRICLNIKFIDFCSNRWIYYTHCSFCWQKMDITEKYFELLSYVSST